MCVADGGRGRGEEVRPTDEEGDVSTEPSAARTVLPQLLLLLHQIGAAHHARVNLRSGGSGSVPSVYRSDANKPRTRAAHRALPAHCHDAETSTPSLPCMPGRPPLFHLHNGRGARALWRVAVVAARTLPRSACRNARMAGVATFRDGVSVPSTSNSTMVRRAAAMLNRYRGVCA